MNQINFEDDQTELLDKMDDVDKLAHKIKEMQAIQKDIEQNEEYLKQRKKDLELISGESISTSCFYYCVINTVHTVPL